MRHAIYVLALASFGSTAAYGQEQIGENCSGTEVIQVGAGASKIVPYTLTFSADLAKGYYCYAECRPEQTYAIKDRASDPIKLTDFDNTMETRLMTFNRGTSVLADQHTIKILGIVTRASVRAICHASPLHDITPMPGD